MKWINRLSVLTLIGLWTTNVMAADVDSRTTNGIIEFGEGVGPGDLIKPNEEDPDGEKEEVITVKDGSSATTASGSLRIQFVPNLNFGLNTQGYINGPQEQPVKLLDYQDRNGNETGNKVPPFVQVTNVTGIDNLGWTLSAKATEFISTDSTPHTLTGAYMSLEGSTLTMTHGTTEIANGLVNKQVTNKIPTDGSSITVLSAENAKSTSGHQFSNVFHNEYTEAGTYTDDTTSGVMFKKPAGITPKKNHLYKSTITWTLADTL